MDRLEVIFDPEFQRAPLALFVNGTALGRAFPQGDRGLVADFRLPVSPIGRAYVERLLGAPSNIAPEGRTPLLVCSECGEIGCGAITARVSVGPSTVVWSDFWWEADYEEFSNEPFPGMRFEFGRNEYEAALGALLKS